jgi:hypothetical protein
LAKEAAWAADFTTTGYLSWYYGYLMMFVSEYVLATGDTSVLPGLKRLALETANGQSGVGTWGHRFAVDHGNLGGYGAMNQPGLSLTIGMVLAREAGVRDPELDRAITKSAEFLRWWLHKGAIPYGDHLPFAAHEDNGKCAAGAVLFDLLGERERGHTGNYFNHLWALLGVARCGPHAIGAYLKEQSWHYDFARGKDNVFLYQPSPEGAEEYRAYIGWDCSGSNLLAFSLPLRSLRITGKKPFNTTPLTPTEAAEVIAASSTKNAQQINCLPDSKAGRLSFANVPLQRSVNARTKTFPPQSCRCLKAQAHQPDMAPSKPLAHSASVPMPAPINSAQHSAIQTLGCNASPPTQLPTSDPTNAKPVSVTCSP